MDKTKYVEKSREGVSIWDRDAATLQEFEETSLVWEPSVAHHKRYLCAPKLMAELYRARLDASCVGEEWQVNRP